jgi:hypothetical protein
MTNVDIYLDYRQCYDHMFNVCKQKHLVMATGGTPIININRFYVQFYQDMFI